MHEAQMGHLADHAVEGMQLESQGNKEAREEELKNLRLDRDAFRDRASLAEWRANQLESLVGSYPGDGPGQAAQVSPNVALEPNPNRNRNPNPGVAQCGPGA